MTYRYLPLDSLVVNRTNDRHGELENETAAIAWLFNNREEHMRNLAKDIVEKGEIYEPPLVSPDETNFIVFDGNRRITCLKLLQNSRRAPSAELQEFFQVLRANWRGDFPEKIQCQVEADRDRIDDILYRRHTGTQSGVGQSTWDDRMKANFVSRTGKETAFNVADEIEKRLREADLRPSTARRIPRSTMNRLLSAEAFRNRVGFSVNKGRFEFIHQEPVVLAALCRIADDLSHKRIVLGDIWDVDGKRGYLDQLESENVLPTAMHALAKPTLNTAGRESKSQAMMPKPAAKPARRTALIPNMTFPIAWAGRLQRHRAIWEELQFQLPRLHPLHQSRVVVLHIPHALAHRPELHVGGVVGLHQSFQFRLARRFLAEPARPIAFGEDHRHAVMQGRDKRVRSGGDDGAGGDGLARRLREFTARDASAANCAASPPT